MSLTRTTAGRANAPGYTSRGAELARLVLALAIVAIAVFLGVAAQASASGHYHCYADGSSYYYSSAGVDCSSGYHSSSGEHVTGHGGTYYQNQVCVANLDTAGHQAGTPDCTTNSYGSAAQTYGTQSALVRNVAASGNSGYIYGNGIWYD